MHSRRYEALLYTVIHRTPHGIHTVNYSTYFPEELTVNQIKQLAKRWTQPARLSVVLCILLIAGIVGDSALWGTLSAKGTDGGCVYNVADTLPFPVFKQNDYILSKSARLTLPALEFAEGISMTETALKAEQELIAERSKPAASGGGSRTAISYGTPVVSGNGQENLANWKASNPDTVAFLRIPGTNINYPVMRGTSYEFKQQSGAQGKKPGAIWVHTGSLSSKAGMQGNTVITGHNWGNCTGSYPFIGNVTSAGRMDQLLSYTSPAFASQNPYITLSIPGEDLTLAVIAAFYVPNIYTDNACIYNGDPVSLAASAKARSLFSSGISVSSGEKLVTFFTCSRYLNTGAKQRFVVVTKVL